MAVVTILFLSAGSALGADVENARDHYIKGTRAYELGLYDEAIAEYMAAYKLKDDPAFLFNLGQAHRLAGHPTEALRFYKNYLAKVPSAENRAEVEAKMAELRKRLEERKSATSAPPPDSTPESPATTPAEPAAVTEPPPVEPVVAPAPVPPIVTPAPVLVTQSVPSEDPGRGMGVAGIVTGASGLALVTTGIVFSVLAKRAGDDLSELDKQKGVFDPDLESAGQRDQLLGGVFLGVGAAAVAAGVVLYVLGARAPGESSQAFALSPAVAPHMAGATCRMVF